MLKNLDKKEEKDLVERSKTDFSAFDKLYNFYLPKIYRYVFRRIRHKQEAEDITALTFEKALLGLDKFKWQGISFSSWLYRIASNNIADYFRKQYKIRNLDFNQAKYFLRNNDNEVIRSLEEKERRDDIRKALKKLPSQYQEILVLKFYEELTNNEMAEVLGCNKKTLAVKLYRSLKALRKIILSSDNKNA